MELFLKQKTDEIDKIVKCENGAIYFLSSLPAEWEKGIVKAFVTPQGHRIDFGWENGMLTYLCIVPAVAESLTIAPGGGIDREITINGKAGVKICVIKNMLEN